MTRSKRLRAWAVPLVIGATALVVAAAAVLRLVTFERHTGYFAPAFSADGRSVYFVERSTTGISWGMGWENLTPPAYARAFADSLSLYRLDLVDDRVVTLEHWNASPVLGRTLRQYRGRLFVRLQASLLPQPDGALQ